MATKIDRRADEYGRWLDRSISLRVGFCLACTAGAVIAFILLPAPMLLGFRSYWDNVLGDSATGLAGYFEFAHDKWRWPVLYTPLFDSPEGTTIYYTDPNPLLAVPGKVLFKLTGVLYPYMGVWLLASYMLNAGLGFLILRHARVQPTAALLSAPLFVLVPAFLWRMVHVTLDGHFLVLASIYAYLRMTTVASRTEILLWSAAVGLLTFVNPYLLAMCGALLIAGLLDGLWSRRISLPTIALALATLAVTMLFFVAAAGLAVDSLPVVGGFTIYSMNLLSPIWPQYSLLSWTPGFLEGASGQYEGFNYLGVGALLLIVTAAATGWDRIGRLAARHRFLVALAVGLFLYSISSVIYIGSLRIVIYRYEQVPGLSALTQILRVPGRFFWPVGYLLLFTAIIVLARSIRYRALIAILLVAVVAQSIELSPLYRLMHANSAALAIADKDAIVAAIDEHTEVRFFPGYLCGKRSDMDPILTYQVAAARNGKPVNGVYVNRGDPQCRLKEASVLADPFYGSTTPNPLLILMRRSIEPDTLAAIMNTGIACSETTNVILCAKRTVPVVAQPQQAP